MKGAWSFVSSHQGIGRRRSWRAKVLFGVALVFGAAVMASAEGYQGPKEKLHVYLLTGGAVMAGEAEPGADDAEVLARCYLLNAEGKWEPAQGALNRFSSMRDAKKVPKLGPARSFAKAMLAANKDISLGLVVR
jgi:Carbohydrate esterase, sialic acid-specific acetylesterase